MPKDPDPAPAQEAPAGPSRETPTALETNVLPITRIVVKGAGMNGAGPGQSAAEYKLVLDYNAIAKAQAHPELSKRQLASRGVIQMERRDLSQILHWAGMTGPDLTIIAWAALDRYHPEVELRTVRQWLAPAQFDQLFLMLVEQCYPGVMERVEQAMQQEEKKTPGAASPKDPASAPEAAPPLPETSGAAS